MIFCVAESPSACLASEFATHDPAMVQISLISLRRAQFSPQAGCVFVSSRQFPQSLGRTFNDQTRVIGNQTSVHLLHNNVTLAVVTTYVPTFAGQLTEPNDARD
jgi:hypothetical protein